MSDYTELQKAAAYAAQDAIKFADEDEEIRALQQFHEEVDPETVLALIAENEALKGPHDWLAEDLIKELVDNAQAIQENADDGEDDPFVIVLLASASRIRRQEANIDKLRAENERLAKTADCWDRLNVQNKALSDSFRAERDQAEQDYKDVVGTIELRDIEISKLRAEVAGLRTGYEAYEQVNAELKAENERLERNRDMWKGQVERQSEMLRLAHEADKQIKAECEGLRKDASLHAQLQRAAEVLPGAWIIEVVVEHHAGWIDVFDDGGNKVVFDGEGHLGEQVSEAIDLVMTLSKESEQ
ncbi:hypothetical protein TX25_29940 [Pseudomonas lactis]|uniref:hypothetical protein n=1 Tax=Pseudomonas lactis TaxID=1615674 RepID=UPI0007144099|nr:hypothetical protein [Pseudomonas lactis]KRP80268.1 hypothetical protein TX25_29940 [Pseudomonas lactis]